MPQPLKSFTKKVIEALPTPDKKRAAYDDSETPGLGLFVHPTGNKTFFWFRRVNGVPTRKTIGEFPALSVENARGIAGDFNTHLAKWKASGYTGPSPFKQKDGVTFGELFDEYHDVYRKAQAKTPARLPEERRRFDRYLKKWANRKMDSLRREEFLDLHSEITKNRGRVTANRTIQLGRRVVNWAGTVEGRERWKGENPFEFKLNKEKPRDRFAQTDELKRLFSSLAAEKNVDVRDFIRLALFTGQRRGDVSAMRWSDLSLTATGKHQWTISNPKNGETHVVPLLPQAVAVLAERQLAAKKKEEAEKISRPFVFPSRGKSGHIRDIKRGWKRLKKDAKVSNLTVHDLRRTLGSWMAMSGVSLPIIGEALGHKSLAATKIYARLQTSAARDAMALAVGKFPTLKEKTA